MADPSIYADLVAQTLRSDLALNSAVNGQIIAGFRRKNADQCLTKTKKCCIGVRNLSLNSIGLPGCAYHNHSDHDQLIEFDIIQIADNDKYISGIANQIEQIMKKPISKTLNGITYYVSIRGAINFHPVDDDEFLERVEITGTARLRYIDE